jgi:hypothetical protein
MLRGLAPLVGLSALAAAMMAGFDARTVSRPASANVIPQLLHPVVTLLLSAAHEISISTPAPEQRTTPRATFALKAISSTPLGGALFLIASIVAIDLRLRRHQRVLLRC